MEQILTGQNRDMTQPTATGAGPPEQFVDVLALSLAGQFNQTQFRELRNLRSSGIITNGPGEMLQQLELITTGVHIDEIDDDHATDIAQFELSRNFNRGFTIRPQHRFPCVGRSCERSRVHIDHGECFRRLDDHVTAGRKIDTRFQCITDGRIHLVVLKQLCGFPVSLHQNIGSLLTQEAGDPPDRGRIIHNNPGQIRPHVITEDAVDEILIAIQKDRGSCGFSGLLNRLPLPEQRLKIIDQQVIADALRLGADQQSSARWLDQHTKGSQSVALSL